jgi:hypothetical protein
MSNQEGPPKIYEELIQNLEADIRKHIRVRNLSVIIYYNLDRITT